MPPEVDRIAQAIAHEYPDLEPQQCALFADRVRGLIAAGQRRADPFLQALGQLRRGAGLTMEQVAAAADWSLSKVHRFEGGAVTLAKTDLLFLLREVYGVTDQKEIDVLVAQARERRARAWG